jgi:hypothetical protein
VDVRACQDRVLQEGEDASVGTVWEACRAAPIVWSNGLRLRGSKGKIACDKRARLTGKGGARKP